MSSIEAYADTSFGSSVCEASTPQDVTPQRPNQAPRSVEEALRRHSSLSEDEIKVTLGRIEATEAWLGPVALEEARTSG